jgi:sulfur carrier protein ThiS
MRIKVRLFGTLGNKIPDHDPIEGLQVDVPEGADIIMLLNQLHIDQSKVGFISIDGRLTKLNKKIKEGDSIRVFRPIFGG